MADGSVHPECAYGNFACRWAYDLGYGANGAPAVEEPENRLAVVYVFVADKMIYKLMSPVSPKTYSLSGI